MISTKVSNQFLCQLPSKTVIMRVRPNFLFCWPPAEFLNKCARRICYLHENAIDIHRLPLNVLMLVLLAWLFKNSHSCSLFISLQVHEWVSEWEMLTGLLGTKRMVMINIHNSTYSQEDISTDIQHIHLLTYICTHILYVFNHMTCMTLLYFIVSSYSRRKPPPTIYIHIQTHECI